MRSSDFLLLLSKQSTGESPTRVENDYWQYVIPRDFPPRARSNSRPVVFSAGRRVHLLWSGRNQNGEFVVLRSSDDTPLGFDVADRLYVCKSGTDARLGSNHGPALAHFQGRLHIAWSTRGQGELRLRSQPSDDGQITSASWDDRKVLPHSTDAPPSLLATPNRLYLSWKEAGSNRLMIASSVDGVGWTAAADLGVRTSSGPTLAHFEGRLHIAWAGDADRHIIVQSSQDLGVSWSGKTKILTAQSNHPPALLEDALGGRLLLAYTGLDGRIRMKKSTSGSAWTTEFCAFDRFAVMASSGPALAIHEGALIAAWADDGPNSFVCVGGMGAEPPLPLQVPSYEQRTPSWCNLGSLTDCVQGYVGAFPDGGIGSVWGETNICYLAGKTGQRAQQGRKFNPVLESAGLQEGENFEKVAWSFSSTDDSTWTDWPELVRQVRSRLLAQHPLALGWFHTRVVVGATADHIFLADPGNKAAGLYHKLSWDDLKQEIIDEIERDNAAQKLGILQFLARRRPEVERRGVLSIWDRSEDTDDAGIALLRSGIEEISALRWGGHGHPWGYWYDDRTANKELPDDPQLGHAWPVTAGDELRYRIGVQNITFRKLDYRVQLSLGSSGGPAIRTTEHTLSQLKPRNIVDTKVDTRDFWAGVVSVGDLHPGLYELCARLLQGGVVQDVQRRLFRIV